MTSIYPSLATIRQRLEWVNREAAGAFCGDLAMALPDGWPERGEYLFSCRTTHEMRNVIQTLHGGSAALIADQAMGTVANSLFSEDGHAPTSQLSLNFHRPMFAGEDLQILVRIINVSRRQIHLSAEIYRMNAPGKLCVSAGAVFFRTEGK